MNMSEAAHLTATLAAAEREVTRALAANWFTLDGVPATDRLLQLQEQLRDARRSLESGQRPANDFSGAVRWVTDWIPDTEDPLVAALGSLERVAQASR